MNISELFEKYGIPLAGKDQPATKHAQRILMVSTHGYWGDPPPAGAPDTGGQTFYVLQVSKAWARQGREVLILVRRFEDAPKVEKLEENLWLVRMDAGPKEFVRKEDIYPLTPKLAEAAAEIGREFGAQAVMGHYADGMVVGAEVAEQLEIPLVVIPHSLGVLKMLNLGMDPKSRKDLRDPKYNFWIRESVELGALEACDLEIPNTPLEPKALEKYYGFSTRHEVMPAGASEHFFAEAKEPANEGVLKKFGIEEGRYIIAWGRFSEAKNFAGVIRAFGEFRKIAPKEYQETKLLVSGGASKNPSEEELRVIEGIDKEIQNYGLSKEDVIRIESVTPKEIACLARASLAYLGMQYVEPFGMAPAEAMAASAPVMISNRAGIVDWLDNGQNAIFVDPDDDQATGGKILELLQNKKLWNALREAGQKKAREAFSWDGIAKMQAGWLDRLTKEPKRSRGYHRISSAWRGDFPSIRDVHETAADQLEQPLTHLIQDARKSGKRAVIVVGGESGSGKTEISHLLTLGLRKNGIRSVLIPGDAFFKLPPSDNHAQRVKADQENRLSEVVGPQEVDLESLDTILAEAQKRSTKEVFVPSESRALPGRRYENVPVALDRMDAVFVDLTYGLMLENVDCRIFLEQSSLKQIDVVRERNLKRDPDQDFSFIERVLECEHELIAPLKDRADLILDEKYDLKGYEK